MQPVRFVLALYIVLLVFQVIARSCTMYWNTAERVWSQPSIGVKNSAEQITYRSVEYFVHVIHPSSHVYKTTIDLIPSNQMNTAGPRELVGSHQLQSPAKERQTLPGVPMASRPKTGTGHTSNESLCCTQKIELKSIFLCTQTSRKHDQEAKDYTILLYRRYRPETTMNCYQQTSH